MGAKTTTWQDLQSALAGSFSARASGVVNPRLILTDRDGREFGRLDVHDSCGARLKAGRLEAGIERIKRAGKARYRMVSGDETVLSADAAPVETMSIAAHEGGAYEVRMSLFRNLAEVTSSLGKTARIEGGFLHRRYEVTLGDDEYALPVAILVLYRLFVARSRAYNTNLQPNTGE